MKNLVDIAGVFAYLSLLTVGGGMAAFPELKTLTVDTYHWMTFPEMLHFYSLGQLAPGPNMMMVASIGAVVSGLPGAAVALIAGAAPYDVYPVAGPLISMSALVIAAVTTAAAVIGGIALRSGA